MTNREAPAVAGIVVAYALGVTALGVYLHPMFGFAGALVFLFLCAVMAESKDGGR